MVGAAGDAPLLVLTPNLHGCASAHMMTVTRQGVITPYFVPAQTEGDQEAHNTLFSSGGIFVPDTKTSKIQNV